MNNPDKFAIATQLYLRLKRNPGRVIDVAWMMQNEPYEREILRIALAADPESAVLANRYESFMDTKPAKFTRSTGSTTGNYTAAAIASGSEAEPVVEQHYIGGLR
ncbi:MAG: hypothetical protein M3O62_04165 [Pseudomonadota bacterium]|nr:hypothetical protein [Pseudomonadota bacterium]